jgi:hypothetical protein
MFILALTILGLSLFSLSGYEAQFLGASQRRSQAFYDALSGIEHTKHVLASVNRFSVVNSNLPPFVVSATALQQGNPSDSVDWDNPNPIVIEVEASRGGESRRIRAAFDHHRSRALYRDVLAAQRIFVDSDSSDIPTHILGVHVEGTIREQSRLRQYADEFDGTWYDTDPTPVPIPQVSEFVSYYRTLGARVPTVQATAPQIDLRIGALDTFGLFEGPTGGFGPGTNDTFGLSVGYAAPIEITLNARDKVVIWMLPSGAHFDHQVDIHGNATAIVIVAGATASNRFTQETGASPGLWFRGGLNSNIPIFLISDGTVAIDRATDGTWEENLGLGYTSIFARGIFLRGPHGYTPKPPGSPPPGDPDFLVHHDRDADDEILYPLQDAGYLPNLLPGRGRLFTLVPGEFREVHEDDD